MVLVSVGREDLLRWWHEGGARTSHRMVVVVQGQRWDIMPHGGGGSTMVALGYRAMVVGVVAREAALW